MTTNNLQRQERTVPAHFEMLQDMDNRLFLKIHTPGTSTIVEVTDCDLDEICEKIREKPTRVR
jgi:hypothetical protein